MDALSKHCIVLGLRARDMITGFEGVATGRLENYHGPPEIRIQPEFCGDDGKPAEAVWFDEGRVELVPGEARVGFRWTP